MVDAPTPAPRKPGGLKMATIQQKYILELDYPEAVALKTLLGSMNDEEFSAHGVSGEARRLMADLWHLLPFPDEED